MSIINVVVILALLMRLLLYDRGWKVANAVTVCHRDCCTNRNCRCPCCCVARHHHCEITLRILLICAITDAALLSCCNSYCVCHREYCAITAAGQYVVVSLSSSSSSQHYRVGSVVMHALYFNIPTMGILHSFRYTCSGAAEGRGGGGGTAHDRDMHPSSR